MVLVALGGFWWAEPAEEGQGFGTQQETPRSPQFSWIIPAQLQHLQRCLAQPVQPPTRSLLLQPSLPTSKHIQGPVRKD